jgi:hypothetical protein
MLDRRGATASMIEWQLAVRARVRRPSVLAIFGFFLQRLFGVVAVAVVDASRLGCPLAAASARRAGGIMTVADADFAARFQTLAYQAIVD